MSMRTTLIGLAVTLAGLASPASAVTFVSSFAERSADGDGAVFQIQLSGPPDFATRDEYGRTADGFAIWVDADAPWAARRAVTAHNEGTPLGNQSVLIHQNLAGNDQLQVAWVTRSPDGASTGGWGDVKGYVPLTLSAANVVSAVVPNALLRDTDGRFWYTLLWVNHGAMVTELDYASGSRTPLQAVPEPSSYALLAGGLLVTVFAARRRASAGSTLH
jgi:PEP-CTERM motif